MPAEVVVAVETPSSMMKSFLRCAIPNLNVKAHDGFPRPVAYRIVLNSVGPASSSHRRFRQTLSFEAALLSPVAMSDTTARH